MSPALRSFSISVKGVCQGKVKKKKRRSWVDGAVGHTGNGSDLQFALDARQRETLRAQEILEFFDSEGFDLSNHCSHIILRLSRRVARHSVSYALPTILQQMDRTVVVPESQSGYWWRRCWYMVTGRATLARLFGQNLRWRSEDSQRGGRECPGSVLVAHQ